MQIFYKQLFICKVEYPVPLPLYPEAWWNKKKNSMEVFVPHHIKTLEE